MRDLLGNKIESGSLLWWISKSIPMKVARIETGGIADTAGDVSPDRLVLEISCPVPQTTKGAETQLSDFLCTLNPDAERIIEGMLAGQRRQ